MIRGAHIARYRGIRELAADGFGRVNLVIGKNDSGKTTFLEALRLAENAEDAARHLLREQRLRKGRSVKISDLERFWKSMFFDLDAKAGCSISVVRDDSARKTLEVRQGHTPDAVIYDATGAESRAEDDAYEPGALSRPVEWALDLTLTSYTGAVTQQQMLATQTRLQLPAAGASASGSTWISSSTGIGEHEIRDVSILKQRGEDGTLVELLRDVDDRLSGIELLAPGGDKAELFVRLKNGTPLLPVEVMGEGFQRCLELGVAAVVHEWPTVFIDEIENGMHHLVLEPLWRWIARISRRRNLQVFATTHSEECIHAACRAFRELDDDGLRVIRLDRMERETRVSLYDQALIAVAERTGTEIRG